MKAMWSREPSSNVCRQSWATLRMVVSSLQGHDETNNLPHTNMHTLGQFKVTTNQQ